MPASGRLICQKNIGNISRMTSETLCAGQVPRAREFSLERFVVIGQKGVQASMVTGDQQALLSLRERDEAISSRLYLISASPLDLSKDELVGHLEPLMGFLTESIQITRSFNNADLILINDSLTVCLQRAYQLEKADGLNIIAPAALSTIAQYICRHFGYAQGALANSLTMLTNKLAAYLSLSEDSEQLLISWVSQVLHLDFQMTKHHYNMAETLIYQLKNRTSIIESFPDLVSRCIDASVDRSLANATTKMLVLVFSGDHASPLELYALWSEPVLKCLESPSAPIILRYMVPALAKQCKPLISYMLEYFGQLNDSNYDIIMALRKIGMDIGEWDPWTQFSERDWEEALTCFDPKIRLDAFEFLVGDARSKSQSKPIDEKVFTRIHDYQIVGSFAIEDIEARQLFILVLLLFIRGKHRVSMRAAQKAAQKSKAFTPPSAAQKSFLRDLSLGLDIYLGPDASYSQLITAVQITEAIVEEQDNDLDLDRLIPGLTSVVFGNYDDARQTAMRALLSIYKAQDVSTSGELYSPDSASTVKAMTLLGDLGGRRSDSGASYIELLIRLCSADDAGRKQAFLLISSLVTAIQSAAESHEDNLYVHGHFKALALTVPYFLTTFPLQETHTSLIESLVACLFDAWEQNKDILSSAVFGGEDETFEQDSRLTYAWKVVKESNALLLSLLNHTGAIDNKVAISIGNLIIEQISTVQHRGVFLSIYFSLIECTEICLRDPALATFPDQWLDQCVSLVSTKVQSISRRSAGLPFLISGLLIAYKKATKPNVCLEAFTRTMLRLRDIARQPHFHISDETVDIAPVHAFNCIKQVISESTLNKESLLFSEDVLELVLTNFSSENWLVRNCAIMLFGVLHKRVFGDKSQASYPMTLFFSRFPRFEFIIMSYLEPCLSGDIGNASSKVDPNVLPPILLMLCELDCSGCKDSTTVQSLKSVLLRLTGNASWHIREMVAKNLVNILDASEFCDFATSVFTQAARPGTMMNSIHTGLLVIKEMLKFDHSLALQRIVQEGYSIISAMPHAITEAYFQAELQFTQPLDTHILTLHGIHLIKLLTDTDKKLNGSKTLCVDSLSWLLLGEYSNRGDGENLKALLELLFESPAFVTSQVKALQYCVQNAQVLEGMKLNISDILWNIIRSDFQVAEFTKPAALQLFSKSFVHGGCISEENARKYCTVLFQLLELERYSAWSLGCIALCTKSFSDEKVTGMLLDRCSSFAAASNPLLHRAAAINAIGVYMSSRSLNNILPEALFILFEKGLFDEDPAVRFEATRLLSVISAAPIHANAHVVANNFCHNLLRVYAPEKVAPQFCSLFRSHAFSAEDDKMNESTLFELEKDNSFVNDIEVAMILKEGLCLCLQLCSPATKSEILNSLKDDLSSYLGDDTSHSPKQKTKAEIVVLLLDLNK